MGELVSVVVPAFNEADGLSDRLRHLLAYLDGRFGSRFEVLVVDDGSTDGTAAIVAGTAGHGPALRLLRHDCNAGLDAAVRTGIAAAAGDIVVLYDADLTYDPATIGELVSALRSGAARAAIASAYMAGGASIAVPRVRKMLSVWANRLLSFASGGRLRTFTCMVRAYDTRFAQEFFAANSDAETTFDILLRMIGSRVPVVEVPATLDWSDQPARRAGRLKLRRALAHSWRIFVASLKTRPSLAIAIPGLVPGLLPLSVAVAAMLHASLLTIAQVALITTIIQYSSLAFFTYQIGDHAFSLWRHRCNFQTTKIAPAVVSEKPN